MDDTPTSTTPQERQHSRLKYMRGSCMALLFGVIGFVAPYLILGGFTVLSWRGHETTEFDRTCDIGILKRQAIFPAVGAAWVFAATGWTTFASEGKYRFAKTLFLITVISVPCWFLLGYMGMSPPRDLESPIIYPSEILLFAIPPIIIACVLSGKCEKQYIVQWKKKGKS